MGILRTDRVSGLGGANAIKGSVEFRADQNIRAEIVNDNADFNYGSGDFTIECWWNSGGDLSTDINFVTLWNYSSSRQAWGMYWDADDGNFGLIASTGGDIGSTDITYRQAANFEKNRWYHLAIVRISNTLTLYKDGTSIGSNSSFTGTIYENTVDPLVIGGQMDGTSESSKIMRGFISNLRIIKGEGIYTGNFTPPTSELTVTPNTVLLACQSPGDILHEATGKKLIAYRKTINDAFPVASHFTPNSPVGFSTTTDVGTQFGSTFDGVTTFDSQAYMVPPGGNTRERNRGRAMWAGGDNPGGGQSNLIDFIQIQSGGIAFDFGDMTAAANQARGVSSFTRGVFGGGRRPHPSTVNTMDFVTIANTANAQDFGDLTDDRAAVGEISSSTRGIFAAGFNPSNVNTIDFITIATLGNASDFGDTTIVGNAMAGTQSTTRGILAGGYVPSTNVIQFLTIATTGNAQDFGDLTTSRHSASGTSNGVRAVFMGGDHASPAADNTIDFITIASTGNATDFGDLGSITIGTGGATSDKIRGVFGTGWNGSNYLNVIQQVTIATTGNSVDIGELTLLRHQPACLGDAHGGLSE